MVSTASDYVRFSEMLLNGGELDGVRLLSPRTIAFMTSDHLPPDIAYSPVTLQLFEPSAMAPTPRDGQGFGLGFAVRTQAGRNPRPGSPGEFYWQGAWGTDFWVDPSEKLIAVLMVQLPFAQGPHYQSLIRNLVYQALITSSSIGALVALTLDQRPDPIWERPPRGGLSICARRSREVRSDRVSGSPIMLQCMSFLLALSAGSRFDG